ncbi:MAG TPA: F0F1 ATP synthase subunit A [Terracidiphilus sp.]|nr:F0F1 ATP synthase subunit A [Terracidiphilus sp.]HUX28274.1 F0F1 ATP synthase subunit A [Terracidiphilus sp.]
MTRLLNELFGGIVASFLHVVGVQANPATVIDNTCAMELLAVAGLIAFFVVVRLTLSVEKPGPVQHVAEMIHEFIGNQSEQVIGHGYEQFQAWVSCIFLFVLVNNLMGLIPGVTTPTSEIVVPLGLAAPTFFYYNFQGLRKQGLIGYLKHFAGPIWWMAWLIFPIEIISHLARILSLTVRLYANMFASDLITLVSFSGFPFGLPVLALGLHAFVSLIQAFVFTLLTMIYLSLAVAHEH